MAYGTRYVAYWENSTKSGTLFIEEMAYVGASEELRLVNDAISITKKMDNWESHIIGDTCEFNIRNDKTDYFTLLDLMKAKERKYRIRVEALYNGVTYLLFAGFVNTEAVTQKYVKYSIINLVASNFLSKLEFVYPDSFDIIGNKTFIDIFTEILSQAGNTYNIRVASFLISDGGSFESGKSFMNRNGITNEIFWKDNFEREDSRTIIEEILKTFQCYMYFWNGYWYIESFDVLFNEDRFYIEYAYNQTYSPLSTGVPVQVSYTTKDVHDLILLDTSQTLTVTPGNRTVLVNIDWQPYFNLTINDFKGIVRTWTGSGFPLTLREWQAWEPEGQSSMEWWNEGLPYKSILNSIKRTTSFPNQNNEDNWRDYSDNTKGLYTKFKLTNEGNVGEQGNTNISIKWKYSVGYHSAIEYKYNVAFHWRIAVRDINGTYIGFIWYNDETSTWQMVDGSSTYINRLIVDSSSINKDGVCEAELNVPLDVLKNYDNPGDVFYAGDYIMDLYLLTEFYYRTDSKEGININFVPSTAYYGDVIISASVNEMEDTQIEGKTNTDFIEKTEVSIRIADAPNWNYKSGILTGDSLQSLTKTWNRNEIAGTARKIEDYILIDKFRTGDVVRESLVAKVRSADFIKLFAMFTEEKQNDMQFLITEIRHDVTHDLYEIKLREYDNTTVINLIEET